VRPDPNLDRILTLAVRITDPDKARWIWDSMRAMASDNPNPAGVGVSVFVIANGHVMDEKDTVEAALDWMLERTWNDSRFVRDVRKADLSDEVKALLLEGIEDGGGAGVGKVKVEIPAEIADRVEAIRRASSGS
jgi:hypothetical protein